MPVMAFPPQHRDIPSGLPSIRTPSLDFFSRHHDRHSSVPYSRSPAMSIPGIETRHEAPPPLPPPRLLPIEGAPSEAPELTKMRKTQGSSISSSNGGYGSTESSLFDRPNFKRRGTGNSTPDEGYASFPSTDRYGVARRPEKTRHGLMVDRSRDSFPEGLSHKLTLPSPADNFSDSMKKMLDPVRVGDRSPPRSLLTSSVSELLARKPADSRFPPLSVPIHSRSAILDPPAHLVETPRSTTTSPRSAPFQQLPTDHRSPIESDIDRSPRQRRRNNSDDASTPGSYDYMGAEDMEMEETSNLKRLHIDDAYTISGQKRRAPGPGHLREGTTRGSPTPRLTVEPPPSASSYATTFSPAVSRSNSYISTASMAPSTISTAPSFGGRSPGGISSGGISPTSCNSPISMPMTLSPRTTANARLPVHARSVSGAASKKAAEMGRPTGIKLQGFLMCECCPKKPKKFETREQLSAHEAEKQYECHYCGNRFKNKNEAERHQNSLHVRRHSWSCSALSGYDRAFHESTSHPGEADTCGYCGEEFARSGRGPGSGALSGGVVPRHATDQDWDERIRHLLEVHKFRECNSSKKFFRADHFRQHLKHSHAGTSGKWTNTLENACMLEEDPTPR